MCVGHYKRWINGVRGKALSRPLRPLNQGGVDVKAAVAGEEAPITTQVAHDKQVAYLQGQVNLLGQKYRAALKQANAQEQILEFNRLAVQALPTVPAPGPLKIESKKTAESVVLVGSCWHIGETINKQEMGGLNEYDFDVFARRLQYVIDKTISYTVRNMQAHAFEEVQVLLTGDMVSGIIHDELEASNQLNIVEQAHLGALVTAQALLELARAFPRVVVTGVVGNHGRVKHAKYYKHKQTVNWDFVFYQTLALLLRNQKNVQFHIPMSFWAGVEIQGHNFLVMHGDIIKSWGSIPFYGINRAVARWVEIQSSVDKFFEYFVFSHFHTKAILQGVRGERIMNASLKGGDEYAVDMGFFNDPIQLLFGVHQKYGKSWELSINAKYASTQPSRYVYDRTKGLSDQLGAVA